MPQNDSSFQINKKSLLTAVIIIFLLIIISYCLTLFVPPGQYDEMVAPDGNTSVVPDSYVETGETGQYPVYNIILSIFKSFAPGGDINVTMIVIMLFILLIGGSFTLLDKSGILGCREDCLKNVSQKNTADRRHLVYVYVPRFILRHT